MNTDRELLELAAKAAGIEIHHWSDACRAFMCADVKGGDPAYGWNPLTDDGDALRLAVRLCMSVHTLHATGATVVYYGDTLQHSCSERGEPLEATRRAIVRAAAAIGETMADEIGRSM